MPLLLIFMALLLPRIAIVLLWLFTTWFQGVFQTFVWPLLGFVFMPLTMLWYSVVHHYFAGEWSLVPIIGLVLAILLDLFPSRLRGRREASLPA